MWIIELNIAGRRFSRQVAAPRRPLSRLAARTAGWRTAACEPRVA